MQDDDPKAPTNTNNYNSQIPDKDKMYMKTLVTRCLAAMLLVVAAQMAVAQTATEVLDKTAEKFKAAKGVKATFTMNAGAGDTNGTIRIQGEKFTIDLAGEYVVWFDGKNMWSYLKDNDEVNVTNPNDEDLAKMNPYAFVNLYKKGYEVKMGHSTAKYYEVILKAKDKTKSLQNATLHINKVNYQPIFIDLSSPKTFNKIKINSYQTNLNFEPSVFTFNPKKYPSAEVIDLR